MPPSGREVQARVSPDHGLRKRGTRRRPALRPTLVTGEARPGSAERTGQWQCAVSSKRQKSEARFRRLHAGADRGRLPVLAFALILAIAQESPFLHEFLRPLDIEETLGGVVSARDGRLAMVTVHRGNDRRPFHDDEIAAIELLLRS